MNNPRNWSDDEIRDYFDSNPNLRMQHLARMVGKSMHELKRILMPGRRQAAPSAPRFNKDDMEYYVGKRQGDIKARLKQTQRFFEHKLRDLPKQGDPKNFEAGFEDWWTQAEPYFQMTKDRYYVLGFLYADDFGRAKHPEWDGRLASAERQAGGGAGVTVGLSGSWRRGGRTNLRPDFVGELEERKGQSGKLQGKVKVEDVSIASYGNNADVKGVAGYLTDVDYSPNDLQYYYDDYREEVEDLGLSVKDIYLSDVGVVEASNVVLSKGWIRAKAPNSFEVELELEGTLNAGNTELGFVNYFPGEAVLVTSTKFKDAYNHIDDWDEMDVDDARYRSASAERVASQYKEAYRTEKGRGGLLFRFDRDGFFVRTEAKDPHGQVYSASATMSGSGKIALRNLAKMWNDPKIRREIMSLRKRYDVMEYIDNALKEMGTRGRLRWHSWHSPD